MSKKRRDKDFVGDIKEAIEMIEGEKGTGTFLSANIRWMKHCSQDLNYRAKLDNLHVQT
jgi:hypothetical protein